jgi:hypothetical protein
VPQKFTGVELPATLPLEAADSGSEHTAAAAETGTAEESVDSSAEQLVLVYLHNNNNNSSSRSSSSAPATAASGNAVEAPSVRYFRLPQEQQQYESAVQQGCRAVPLPWALQRGAGGAMSMEELAWLNQQQGCWGLDAATTCALGGDADADASSSAEAAVVGASADAGGGASGVGEVPGTDNVPAVGSEQQQQQPAATAAVEAVAAAVGAGKASGSRDDGSNGSATVKVRPEAAAAAHVPLAAVLVQLLVGMSFLSASAREVCLSNRQAHAQHAPVHAPYLTFVTLLHPRAG